MSVAELLVELETRGVELWAEGDRLRFRAPEGAITPELRERLTQHRDEALTLVRERGATSSLPHPLSYQQRSLWFLHQAAPLSDAYNVGFAVRIRSHVDRAILRDSLQALVDRHASLRTVFGMLEGEPVQYVRRSVRAHVEVLDEPSLDEAALRARVAELHRQPFDLRTGPLLRTVLISHGDCDHVLLIAAHHIAVDGWSAYVLIDELRALYDSRRQGRPAVLPRPAAEYTDFVAEQAKTLAEDGERLWSYWNAQLQGALPVLSLPTDRPRPSIQRYSGASHPFTISEERCRRLKEFAREEGATLFVTVLAVFQTMLCRYSGQEDLIVGTPSFGRTQPAVQGVVGHFVNTLPLHADLSSKPSFRSLVRATRECVLGALANEAYPFPLMVQRLGLERDPSRPTLVQVMFALQKAQRSTDLVRLVSPVDPGVPATIDFGGLTVEAFPLSQQEGQFDLMLEVGEADSVLLANLKFNSDLFDRETMVRLQGYLETLIDSATAEPDASVYRLPMVPASEQRLLLDDWSGAGKAWPADTTVTAAFEARVHDVPDQPAVTCDGTALTYAELNERANQLAHRLRGLGVGPDTHVGMYVERSLEMLVGIVGILKAGGAYVPIDPAYPPDRARFMLEDADTRVVLTASALRAQLPEMACHYLCLDDPAEFADQPTDNPAAVNSPGDLAYIIYTSGSTGRPKGVQVTHDNVIRLFRATDEWFGFDRRDVWTLFHSYAFDFSVWEIWGALLYGGRLVIVPYWVSRDPASFYELLLNEAVTVLNQTPSAFRQLIAAEPDGADPNALALRYVVFGGEALEPASLRNWVDRHGDARPRLINMYGITETTVHVTYRLLTVEEIRGGAASVIGVPIPDLRLYVLDAEGALTPVGASGEMYVGGAGVARGYLNRPELNEQRFVPDRFGGAGRLYRSGDLARRLPSGDLEYLGRIDHQVKIRGFRIELGEIEAALAGCPGVGEAAVLPLELSPGDIRLVGCVVAAGDVSPDEAAMKGRLRETLPAYMVPSAIIVLTAFPLTSNGKLDRRRLLSLSADALQVRGSTTARLPPETETEGIIAAIWCDVLKVTDVARDDSFFDLGGHSIVAVQIVARVRERFGFDVPLRAIFEGHTLRRFAAEVERAGAAERGSDWIRPALVALPRTAPLSASFTQERLWFIQQLWPESAAYHVPVALRLSGALNLSALQESWRTLVARHEGLRTRFEVVNDQLFQVPDAPVADVSLVDVGEVNAADREREFRRLADDAIQQPFDLSAGPLARPLVIRMGPDEHVLLLVLHHIVCDQWSLGVMLQELAAMYRAARTGQPAELPPLPIQYADYAAWQRRCLEGDRAERLLSYWRHRLVDLPVVSLPTDHPRPAALSLRGDVIIESLDRALLDRVRRFATGEHTTLATSLLAAFAALLGQYTGDHDFPIGVAVANREHSALDHVVGAFINTLVIRIGTSGAPDFRELTRRVHDAATEAYNHQEMPFDYLVARLQPNRDLSRSPLVQVMFNVLNAPAQAGDWQDLRCTPMAIGRRSAQFDLTVHLHDESGTIAVEYSTDLFEEATIRRLLAHYATVLQAMVDGPESLADSVDLLSAGERERFQARDGRTEPRPSPKPSVAVLGRAETRREGLPPATDTERALANVWVEVLRVPEVYADDNFFALGGHSLLATQVIGRIRDRFRINLPLRRMFEADSLRALAIEVDAYKTVAQVSGESTLEGDREEIEL